MSLRLTLAASIAAIATLAAAGANAAVLYDAPAAIPEQVTGTSYDVNFVGASGAADLSFTLNGYASLDGQNWYEDDFTLALNGLDILKATWNLGGGGYDVVYSNPLGLTINNVSGNGTAVTWAGGHVNIAGAINLQGGANTLSFRYDPLPYNNGEHAGWQDMGDEGWGVQSVLVTQGAVPEPATWAMLIMGFGAMGSVLRRSRRQLVPVRA